MMTLNEIKNLGRVLTSFLALFADCFTSLAGRQLLRVYVKGQLSDIQRKNCEAIALKFDQAPKTRIKFYLKRGIDVDKIKSCVASSRNQKNT